MKITLSGNINRTYVQGLCMAFFHGIRFPENSDVSGDGFELYVATEERGAQIYTQAQLTYENRTVKKDNIYIPSNLETPERACKTAVGQTVYAVCKELSGNELEWGILTGIRPSKVCAELLSKCSESETEAFLMEKYLLSKEKASLAITVAKNETKILNMTNENECSIYISIPFCPSRCNYCSFISYTGKKLFDLIPAYLERLFEEIKTTVNLIDELGLRISCIYIGGGTPTILDENQLESLLRVISSCINPVSLDEFTLEGGRPDTITDKKLEIAQKYGVTRISVNPQTLNDAVLERIGRRHTAQEFFEAYKKVANSKLKLINTDLIAGLDGDDFESFKTTVDSIISLSPSNVTVHTFCVKKSAQILRDDSNVYAKEDEDARLSVDYAYKSLVAHGYVPYYMYRQKNTIGNLENVGYAKKDALGLYNVFMMSDAHTVFGIGAGATTKLIKNNNSKTEILRIFSPKYPYEYLRDNQKTIDKIKKFFDRG